MGMTVLYVSYWGLSDPLTVSSVLPTLTPLKKHLGAQRLTLITIERSNTAHSSYQIPFDFVDHVPLKPIERGGALLAKADELLLMPGKIRRICLERGIDLIFARCSLAGTIAYKVHKSTGIPFVVESFEPHSEYMANCGSWTRGGLRFRYARRYEKLQMQTARKLITVTENYREHLVKTEGVEESRIAVIPCVTDLEHTRFDPALRRTVRERLGLGQATTGIYVGKFGDLYYDAEAFVILQDAFGFFEDFRLILLTPAKPEQIRERLRERNIPADRVHITSVARSEVPAYLSAADFAYSFVRPHAASPFQSPIKHGEYWACGLPFITPDGIGDDCRVIASEGGGANIDFGMTNIRRCHEAIAAMLRKPDYRDSVRQLAVKYKSAEIIDAVFARVFGRTAEPAGMA
jgi:Glycosyltransferase Family 4